MTVSVPYTFFNDPDPASTADADQVNANFQALVDALNGQVITKGGKSIVAGGESRTNTAYGLLPTPDRVSGIVLPTDALMFVAYQATWQSSVSNAARAAIFVGSNQLRVSGGVGNAGLQAAAMDDASNPNTDRALATMSLGLVSGSTTGGSSSDATTGQVVGMWPNALAAPEAAFEFNGSVLNTPASVPVGGACAIFAAAGTYDISVQFKASSGSVTAKNRKLWVWTIGF